MMHENFMHWHLCIFVVRMLMHEVLYPETESTGKSPAVILCVLKLLAKWVVHMEEHETIVKNRSAALRAAFPATIPVMTGYLCLGAAFGILLRTAGYGIGWSIAMSMICYCGSMQFVGVSLLTAAFDPFQALLMSVMVNARHAFYGLSMLEKYRGTGPVRPVLICTLTDETFSLVSTLEPPEGVARRDFYFWISLLDYLYWQVGCTLGNAVGGLLTFDTTGLDFTLTALFIVLLLEQVKKKENRAAGIIGLVCTAASLVVFGPDNFLIPAMILLLAVLLGGRKRLCK